MVGIAPHCTALDITKFSSLRVLKVFFERLDEQELQTIPWLGQLVALPQLTRVVLMWGDIRPGRFLMQLPAGCELEFDTHSELSASLPHCASLAHLVDLEVWASDSVDFSCLAACPNLRRVRAHSFFTGNLLDWLDLSTLNHVPDRYRCSVVLQFKDAAMRTGSFEPPSGWSVAPGTGTSFPQDELIFSRNGSQDCTVDVSL